MVGMSLKDSGEQVLVSYAGCACCHCSLRERVCVIGLTALRRQISPLRERDGMRRLGLETKATAFCWRDAWKEATIGMYGGVVFSVCVCGGSGAVKQMPCRVVPCASGNQ